MSRLPTVTTSAVCCVALLLAGQRVAAQAADPVDYMLEAPSAYSKGCFDPCACPVTYQPMSGQLVLEHVNTDPFFRHYTLRDIDWKVGPGAALHLTGSGEYRVGTEFPSHHRMIVELSVNGGPVQHYDSGLVAGGADFPQIRIEVAANGFACFDTVLTVHAIPRTPTAIGPNAAPAVLAAAGPNPFHGGTAQFEIVLAVPGTVDLAIYDVRGRVVRTLLEGAALAAGRSSIRWDGSLDGGSRAPSGVYVVRLASNGRTFCRRIAKLE
jgi:hypothetical protein